MSSVSVLISAITEAACSLQLFSSFLHECTIPVQQCFPLHSYCCVKRRLWNCIDGCSSNLKNGISITPLWNTHTGTCYTLQQRDVNMYIKSVPSLRYIRLQIQFNWSWQSGKSIYREKGCRIIILNRRWWLVRLCVVIIFNNRVYKCRFWKIFTYLYTRLVTI